MLPQATMLSTIIKLKELYPNGSQTGIFCFDIQRDPDALAAPLSSIPSLTCDKFVHSLSLMQLIKFSLSTIFFAVCALAAIDPNPDAPKELVVKTTYLPEDCTSKAKSGDSIQVHYSGTLFANGNKFDSSYDRGRPLPLTLGVGQVIKGWDEGLQGMCVGEKRTLTIPPNKAYGTRGAGKKIPGSSTLVFDVELMGLESRKDEL